MTGAIAKFIGQSASLAALLCCALASTHGAPINYGDFSDIPPGSVMYLDVTETANSPGDNEPLYGQPSIVANTLGFQPSARYVSAGAGGSADITDGQLDFTLSAVGNAITSLHLTGAGDFSLTGTGSAGTSVGYRSSVSRVDVLEVDGIPVASPVVLPGLQTFQSFELGNGPANGSPWNSTLTYDLNAALSHAGVSFQHGATKLDVVVNNVLDATGELSSMADIGASSYGVSATTVPVPEPAGMAFAGLVMGCIALIRRR